MFVCTLGIIISSLISSFTTGLVSFSIARFFVMFFTGGHHSTIYVFMLESLPTKHRMWILTVITYSPNYLVFAAVAYLSGDWRTLARACTAITVIPLLLLWFVCESPRWLMQKGKFDEARKVITHMEKWSGTQSSERIKDMEMMLLCEKEEAEKRAHKKRYYVYHLFYTRSLATYTIVISFSLMTTSVIQYGLLFNMEKISGSIYWNAVYFGLFRYSMNICTAVVDYCFQKAGRRLLHGIAMSFIASCLGIVLFIYILGMQDTISGATRVFAIGAAGMCSQIYILDSMAFSELFPTAVRNAGNGFIHTWSRIGNIIAPQIFLIAELWSGAPYVAMFLLAVVELTFYECLVPESKGKKLSDHMPGSESRNSLRESEAKEPIALLEAE